MSMRKAMENQCTGSQPIPFTPITNPNPPYGDMPDESLSLGVSNLISKLLAGTFVGTIDHIDVWGEGRVLETDHCTGFPTSFNINLNQGITLPGYKYHGYAIPNLLPLCQYSDSFDVIPDKCTKTVSIMGAPITANTAEEMARIVSHEGVVIALGYEQSDPQIALLKASLSKIGFVEDNKYELGPNYLAVTLEPKLVFSASNNPDPSVHDEL